MDNKPVATIKFLEGRIITNKDGQVETWSSLPGTSTQYIVYKGTWYKLINGSEKIENKRETLQSLDEELDDYEQ